MGLFEVLVSTLNVPLVIFEEIRLIVESMYLRTVELSLSGIWYQH